MTREPTRTTLLPGAQPIFTIRDVLPREQLDELVDEGERAGFRPAPITTPRGFLMAPSVRSNTRYMVDDPARAAWLWEHLRRFVPTTLAPAARAVGLNERFRMYRYDPGQYFRWHRDGYYQRRPGERSRLTMLLYLNDNFDGGETEFAGGLRVTPERGLALVFAHHLRHQGAPVLRGRKYVLRTDIMYRDELAASATPR